VVYISTFGVYDRSKIDDSVVRESHPIGGHNLYATTKVCSEHLVHAYAALYKLDTAILRPGGVFGRGFYVGGSTVGKIMRDLALNIIKGEPITLDARTYGLNEAPSKRIGTRRFPWILACRRRSLVMRRVFH
jgi:nucleoside-diphosphate-sugar epimerase